jgi:hypothetical protein
VAYPLTQHEQHGHHRKCHVMTAGVPFANLVIGHTTFTLGILKRYFGLGGCVHRLGNPKKKTVCLARFAIPHINQDTQSAKLQKTTGGIAKLQHGLLEKGHPLYNRFYFEAFGIGAVTRKIAASTFSIRSMFLRVPDCINPQAYWRAFSVSL